MRSFRPLPILHHDLCTALRLRPSRPPSHRRRFHATPSARFLEPLLQTTHTILQTLHSTTHLPWVLTLPLTALLVRATFTFPMALYTRKAQVRQIQLRPVLAAWVNVFRGQAMAEEWRRGDEKIGPVETQRRVLALTREKRRELYKRWECGWWKNWLPVLQLPVFLVVVEAVRRMCGTREGLLGLVSRPWRGGGAEEAEGAEEVGIAAAVGVEMPVGEGEKVVGLGDILFSLPHTETPDGATDLSTPTPLDGVVGMDPTLSQEGALWFPDLLLPDPYLLLPFILSATIFANIAHGTRNHDVTTRRTRTQRVITNALKVIALAIGPLTLQMPSAILVYWISSSGVAVGQAWVVDRIMPMPKTGGRKMEMDEKVGQERSVIRKEIKP